MTNVCEQSCVYENQRKKMNNGIYWLARKAYLIAYVSLCLIVFERIFTLLFFFPLFIRFLNHTRVTVLVNFWIKAFIKAGKVNKYSLVSVG